MATIGTIASCLASTTGNNLVHAKLWIMRLCLDKCWGSPHHGTYMVMTDPALQQLFALFEACAGAEMFPNGKD